MSKVRETLMEPVQEELICDCGGVMRQTGVTQLTNPQTYQHKCGACGAMENAPQNYPRITYRVFKDPTV